MRCQATALPATPRPTVPPVEVPGAAFTVYVLPPQMLAVTIHTPLS